MKDYSLSKRSALRINLGVVVETWKMAQSLTITGHTFDEFRFVVVTLSDGVHQGRGEAAGVYYLKDVPATMVAQIEAVRECVESGITREELRSILPPGGARNAIDCALWDLESQQLGKPVWELAGVGAPQPLLTTYTLGADAPEVMARGARDKYRDAKAIKLKLLGDDQDAARVQAVRAARDDVWIGVDANQGFTAGTLTELLPTLIEARVQLIEQPCKIGDEAQLDNVRSPIPFAADESVQSLSDVAALAGRFQVVNIKLDKCGGLTEALLMAKQARHLGIRVMVGNMGGTSLAMAPAMIVGQCCDIVDLDGPLFLTADRNPAIVYEHGLVSAPTGLYGWPGV
ncbi:dipeptide epimerase [Rhodanobacter glycinis]|uniref:Dipeptide epimerase n=1 Tax=Rhodanobacter glycinis TaxID=582702 RepID=A0A5B9E3X8_9GAMM|nr:dipeptide epimerase [Rhodanobacter glycinis]QEE24936.1 dipeptide epimerase [Rhodanobacter glycinis]